MGFEGLSGESIIHADDNNDQKVVWDLWTADKVAWDKTRVQIYYGNEMANRICNIPLINDGPSDRIIWHYAPNGIFTTKLGYSWLNLKKLFLALIDFIGEIFGN